MKIFAKTHVSLFSPLDTSIKELSIAGSSKQVGPIIIPEKEASKKDKNEEEDDEDEDELIGPPIPKELTEASSSSKSSKTEAGGADEDLSDEEPEVKCKPFPA